MDLPDYDFLSMPRGRPVASDRHRTPRGHATAPSPPHTAAQQLWVTPMKEQAPKPNSASGECQKEPSPVPDRAGYPKKRGNPNTIQQQTVHERSHLLLYVLLNMVGRWVGLWVGCCTCCCCSTTAIVLLYMVDAGG